MKKIIISILFFIMIIIFILIDFSKYKNHNTKSISQNKILIDYFIIEKKANTVKNVISEDFNGFKVSSKITIPKINLESLVLQNFSDKALKVCVTKFWGADANEIGNFCIAGHNFKNKNMFHDLKKLDINDNFFIEDNKNGKYEYKIYNIYNVFPNDTSCLSQNTNGEREVTLITCTFDSIKRVIIKAKEV